LNLSFFVRSEREDGEGGPKTAVGGGLSMEEDGGGGTKMATEGPQVMRRRKYDLMPQAYKDELVRASQEDATAWDDARFKAAWQKLTAAEQKNLIEDAASAAKAAAGKPNAKRRRELGGQGPSKSANTGASSGKSVIGEGASPSPPGGQWRPDESNDDDDAIFLAALEMAEQQHASRTGHPGKSRSGTDAQHPEPTLSLDGVQISRDSGGENVNAADAGASGVSGVAAACAQTNTLPDQRHLARICELEAQLAEARKQAPATVPADTTLTSLKQKEDETKKTEEKLAKEREKQEKERLKKEKAEKEKVEKEEKERLKKEHAEMERTEKERIKQEKAEKDKAEKEEKKRLKKETEEKDKQEKERIKLEKEAAKQRAQEEKDSKYLAKIQELEAGLAEARKQAAAALSAPPLAEVDASALPRITADTTVAVLKAEAQARGQKVKSSLGKGGLLEILTVGSILLSQTCEYKRYQQVLSLLASEQIALRAARQQKLEQQRQAERAAEQKLEQQRQVERARRAAEEKQREAERVAALHTHKSTVHHCPLAKTMELPYPGVSCKWGDVRANGATCNFCHGLGGADGPLFAGLPHLLPMPPSGLAALDIRGKPGCTGCGAIRGGHVSGCFCHMDGDPARDLRGLHGCTGCGKKQGCHALGCKGVGDANEDAASLAVCIWSCIKCDFDVCADCYEIESLPESQRAAKRAELELQRKRQKEEARKRAAAEELKRAQREQKEREEREKKRREQEEREEREIEAKLGKFQPQHKKIPEKNRKPLKKGFIVYHTEGDHYHKGDLEFDSSWATVADANARAKFLFYHKNCWGLSVREMLGEQEGRFRGFGYYNSHEPPQVEMKSGMVQLYSQGGESDYWKVAVVPCTAFEHLPRARMPGQRNRDDDDFPYDQESD